MSDEDRWMQWTDTEISVKVQDLEASLRRLKDEDAQRASVADRNAKTLNALRDAVHDPGSFSSDAARDDARKLMVDCSQLSTELFKQGQHINEQRWHLVSQLQTFKALRVKRDPAYEFRQRLSGDIRHLSRNGKMGSLSEFKLLQGLGKGSFGAVFLVEHEIKEDLHGSEETSHHHSGRSKARRKIMAMKVVPQTTVAASAKRRRHLEIERRVMARVRDHPFIVTLQYALQSPSALYFLMDYCAGGDLFYHLCQRRTSDMPWFPEATVQFLIAEVVLALGHLHQNLIVYRDLKPENVMLDVRGHVKLVDFGLAKENVTSAHDDPMAPCGSAIYVAPEVLGFSGGYMVDWWSLGVLMFELLSGVPPWTTKDRKELFMQIRELPIQLPGHVSVGAKELILGLLDRNPARRLGAHGDAKEIQAMMFFPWSKSQWQQLEKMEVDPPFNPCAQTQRNPDGTTTKRVQLPINFDMEASVAAMRTLESIEKGTVGRTIATPRHLRRKNRRESLEEDGPTFEDPEHSQVAAADVLFDFEPVNGEIGRWQKRSARSPSMENTGADGS